MPRREDERQLLSGKHPVYCTCTDCTERFLQKKGFKSGNTLKRKLLGRAGREKAKAHPADCACATCNLLRSMGSLAAPPERKSGLLHRLFKK